MKKYFPVLTLIVLLASAAAMTSCSKAAKNKPAPQPSAVKTETPAPATEAPANPVATDTTAVDTAASGTVSTSAAEPANGIVMINPAKLKEMMSDKNVLLIDVREPQELAAPLPTLKGAVNIPLNKLIANPGQVPKDKKIVVICRSGHRSTIAAQALYNSGYKTIYNLEGGLLGYYGD